MAGMDGFEPSFADPKSAALTNLGYTPRYATDIIASIQINRQVKWPPLP